MDHIPSQSYLLNQCTRNSDSSKFYNVSFITEEPGLSSFELSSFKYTEFQLDFINDYPMLLLIIRMCYYSDYQ